MKYLNLFLIMILSNFAFAQTFTNIAPQEGITFSQVAPINHGNGMSFFDFDEDGWDDLTFPTNVDSIFLYRNNFGSYVKLPSIYAPGEMRQFLWVDYDNDGDLDIFCSFHDIGVRLYSNDGSFQFSDVTSLAGFSTAPFEASGFSFSDPDADGDLDVYICAYYMPNTLYPTPNKYYENQGNGTFIDMAATYGIDDGLKSSFMPAFFDVNNDNILDLHIINDRHPYHDELFLHSGSNNYTPVSYAYGIDNDGHFPMSLSVADYNNDGFQDVFKSDAANGTIWNGQPLDYKLYRNNGGTSFTDVAPAMNINFQAFAWGGLWVDYNNDSFEDLYVATGFIDTFSLLPLTSVFFENNQGLAFNNITDSIQSEIIKTSYCPVKGDINNDGFYDMAILNGNDPPDLMLNSGNGNNFVRITVVGTESNRMAIGSLIKVYANNTCQTQTIFCGSGLHAQNSQHKIFGIGTASVVDSVVVTFPNGNVAKRFNLQAGMDHEIWEKTMVQIPLTSGQPSNNFCLGDTVEIGVSGMHNYQWSTGETTSHIQVDTTGVYSFTAQNGVGDSLFQSHILVLIFHDGVPHQTVVLDAPCGNNSYGSAEVIPLNPGLIDSIVWSNGDVGTLSSNLSPGNYSYEITSIHGCLDSGVVTVDAISPFSSQFFTTPATDQNGGTVQVYTWGGTPPFTYTLDGFTVSAFTDNLNPGLYEMIIEDAMGCTDTLLFEIQDATTAALSETNASQITIDYSDQELTICGVEATRNYEVEVINGLGQRVSHWSNDATQNCPSSTIALEPGWYIIFIQFENQLHTQKLFIN